MKIHNIHLTKVHQNAIHIKADKVRNNIIVDKVCLYNVFHKQENSDTYSKINHHNFMNE